MIDALDRPRQLRAARVVTELTSPTILAPVLLIAIAFHDTVKHGLSTLGWGIVAGIFTGAAPLAFLTVGVRRGRWDDHHVHRRELRWLPLVFAIASVTVGFVLLTAGHAPGNLTILILAMLPGLGSVLIISHWWKISIHAAVASGATVVLATVFGLAGVTLGAVVLLAAGWARVALGAHTPTQVLAGSLLGGCVAAAVFVPLH
jgi:membrane-associated phospholipid phosphatase